MALSKLASTLLRDILRRRKSAQRNSLNGVVSLAKPPTRRNSPARLRNGSSLSSVTDLRRSLVPAFALGVVGIDPSLIVHHPPERVAFDHGEIADDGHENVLDALLVK